MYVTDTEDIEFKPYFTGFDTFIFSYRNNNDYFTNYYCNVTN